MNRIILIILLFVNYGYCQTSLDQIRHAVEKELSKYHCEGNNGVKIMCDTLFNEQIENIFSTVVLNSSDIITNGSAISFAQDKDKGTFSFNTTLPLPKHFYMDVGLSYSNKDNFSLNFYSKNALTNDLGLKLGFLWRLNGVQKIEGTPCHSINNEREKYMRSIKMNEYKLLLLNNISQLQTQLDYEYDKEAITEKELSTKIESIASLKKKIEKLNKIASLDEADFQSLVKKDFYNYDKENINFSGYSIKWFNLNGNFKNSKISDKYIVIPETISVQKNDDVFRMTLELSFNYFHEMNQVVYWQAFINLNRGSFLDSPIYKDNTEYTLLVNPITSDVDVAFEGQSIRPYSDLEKPYIDSQIGGQVLWLFTKNKNFGISMKSAYNYAIEKDLIVPFKNNFSFLLGPTFKSNDSKDTTFKLSKSIITLLSGFEQVPIKTNVWDSFIVKVSLGIPLSLFKKK